MHARSQVAGDRNEPRFYLPDFCAARSVLAVVLIAELVALLLSLGRHGLAGERLWPGLAETSLFLLWTGLGVAAVLCAARGTLSRLSVPEGSALALALLLAVTGLVSEGAWWFAASTERVFGFEPRALSADHLGFLLRNLMIGAIAGGLALRYFYVSQQWRRNVEAEAQSRVRALQARIRPHFLFNSMNTIAALTRTDPRGAEQAIADLADLFRVSLREHGERIPLGSELEIAQAYERLERLRLGDRLQLDWQVDGLPRETLVPALILQPLLENAVYHGIEPLPAGGTIRVAGRIEGRQVALTIDNPTNPRPGAPRPGHRIGLDNVRQRLELMFQGEASLEVLEAPERFIVTLRFPMTPEAA
jgi:two-component system sensor histidine kinase AlgZ